MYVNHGRRGFGFAAQVAWACVLTCDVARAAPPLPRYDSPYYTIHSDLGSEPLREATLRITRTAEEYHERTTAFAGKINRRLHFYLFSREEDYLAAGGLPGSAGVYTGDRLMACLGEAGSARAWKTVQHEGFHQFVDAVIRGDIPVWVNEGLAEYFGEGVFTGDEMVTGVIPPSRLQRIQHQIRAGGFMPFSEFMALSQETWNARLSRSDYDQAWSMVHFLAHGDGGRYEKPFSGFLRMTSTTPPWRRAWTTHFGDDLVAFEKQWREYWLGLSDDATDPLYAKTVASVLTSFLARATSQDQLFDSLEAFVGAAEKGELKAHPEDWLPPSLLESALKEMNKYGEWTLDNAKRTHPRVIGKMKDGTRLEGRYRIANGRVSDVSVEITRS